MAFSRAARTSSLAWIALSPVAPTSRPKYIPNQRLLDRELAPPVAPNDRRLERLLAQRRYPQPCLASLGLQAVNVTPA
jgi:hypothetical protein